MSRALPPVPVVHYRNELIDGAPIGYRLALRHPGRVSALIVQNGNAYLEGLGDTGHFALEDKLDVIAPLVRDFLDRTIEGR